MTEVKMTNLFNSFVQKVVTAELK